MGSLTGEIYLYEVVNMEEMMVMMINRKMKVFCSRGNMCKGNNDIYYYLIIQRKYDTRFMGGRVIIQYKLLKKQSYFLLEDPLIFFRPICSLCRIETSHPILLFAGITRTSSVSHLQCTDPDSCSFLWQSFRATYVCCE